MWNPRISEEIDYLEMDWVQCRLCREVNLKQSHNRVLSKLGWFRCWQPQPQPQPNQVKGCSFNQRCILHHVPIIICWLLTHATSNPSLILSSKLIITLTQLLPSIGSHQNIQMHLKTFSYYLFLHNKSLLESSIICTTYFIPHVYLLYIFVEIFVIF